MAQNRAAQSLRLVQLRGDPTYIVGEADGDRAVSGVTGGPVPPLTAAEAGRIAGAFGGQPVSTIAGPLAYDQWVVHQGFDHARPLYRVRLADREATELYVAARTGEVVQRTRVAERGWNWLGAVIHWLYVTPLRRSFVAWDTSVWALSLVGLLTALIGVGLGVLRSMQSFARERRRPSPFRGWLQWHHLVGLGAAVVVVGWILSGWLSMDHGRLFSRGSAAPSAAAAYAGATLIGAAQVTDTAAVARLNGSRRVDFSVLGGRLVISTPDKPPAVSETEVRDALRHAWPDASVIPRGPASPADFWARAEGLGGAVDRYDLVGRKPAHVYVDRASGRMLAVVDRSREAYAILYYGLHTFQWPGLTERPLLRNALVCFCLLIGGALSVTSLVVAWRRVLLSFRPDAPRGRAASSAGPRSA